MTVTILRQAFHKNYFANFLKAERCFLRYFFADSKASLVEAVFSSLI